MIWSISKTLIHAYLKIDKKSSKNIGIYNIASQWYITDKKIDDYKNIHSAYSLYLMIGKVIGHIKEKIEVFSFWFNGIAFYKWKQRNIKKIQTPFGMGLKMKLRP